jgi:hypothetical protein
MSFSFRVMLSLEDKAPPEVVTFVSPEGQEHAAQVDPHQVCELFARHVAPALC